MVKENDDFVQKMKKEIDQAKRCAREKRSLEKQVQELQDEKKKDEVTLAQLQSDLKKVIGQLSQGRHTHKTEMIEVEKYCAGRFAVVSKN